MGDYGDTNECCATRLVAQSVEQQLMKSKGHGLIPG